MNISVMGTGNMGKALVKQLGTFGNHSVLWGSRDPTRLQHSLRSL
ncbi:hypothetical protein J42TS3_00780 [Paenibacillus vini]|uniref:Pyrroline-5-carboxylate reductase catalytic N-terminal domain-containing protein n=1 Tax=Paenibacillus vini TaxID=1476024 RepID=A0ABQ4M4W3_9BACL|nr:hypothetical protein J42TS3_00780 [Paenibacillus vini]